MYSDGRSQNALLANFAPFDCCDCVKIKKRSEVRFYSVKDLQEMTVRKLFYDRRFPSQYFGRTPLVEAHALISFFMELYVQRKEKETTEEIYSVWRERASGKR